MKLESIIKKGKQIALAGVTSLAILGCTTVPPKKAETKPEAVSLAAEATMSPAYLKGKSLNDHFREFDKLNPGQQEDLAKSMNNLSAWDLVLLSRYVPVDGMMGKLSSFYLTDYKGFLQTALAESGLDMATLSMSNSKGIGQLSKEGEEWARTLYGKGYKFPGQAISNDSFDPYTNLVLSSILFRKGSEEKVSDLDAVCALYNNGFKGVSLNKEGTLYEANEFGAEFVNRVKAFDVISNEMIAFSWLSNRKDLLKNIEDVNLRKVAEMNTNIYDGKIAYEGMINFLNYMASNKKYSDETKAMFKHEADNITNRVRNIYK